MRREVFLRIVDLSDGSWEFDIKKGMSDEEIRKLLSRIKYVENDLIEHMGTDLIKVADNIEYLQKRKKKYY